MVLDWIHVVLESLLKGFFQAIGYLLGMLVPQILSLFNGGNDNVDVESGHDNDEGRIVTSVASQYERKPPRDTSKPSGSGRRSQEAQANTQEVEEDHQE